MADLEVLRRRLLRIVEQRRPDIAPERRVKLVNAIVEGLAATDNLTAFWTTLYEHMPPVEAA